MRVCVRERRIRRKSNIAGWTRVPGIIEKINERYFFVPTNRQDELQETPDDLRYFGWHRPWLGNKDLMWLDFVLSQPDDVDELCKV